MAVRVALLCLLLLFARSGLATAQADEAGPTPDPCATTVPNDITTAFAYELRSRPILRFISALRDVRPNDQKRIFDRAVTAAASPAARELETAESSACPSLDGIYGFTRALAIVANEWRLGELDDRDRSNAFAQALTDAVAALSLGSVLAADERRVALLPFADLVDAPPPAAPESPAALQSPASLDECAEPNVAARTVHAVAPNYPPLAAVAGTSGNVNLLISLSSGGDVRSIRVVADTLGGKLGSDDIIRAAIVAAAASSFAPAIRHCAAVDGRYVFVVEFHPRR